MKLLRQARADVALADTSGKTAIDLASANRIPADVAAALFDDSVLREAPSACLVATACIGNIELVKLSIAAKASVDQLSEQSARALSMVIESEKNTELVKLLLDAR